MFVSRTMVSCCRRASVPRPGCTLLWAYGSYTASCRGTGGSDFPPGDGTRACQRQDLALDESVQLTGQGGQDFPNSTRTSSCESLYPEALKDIHGRAEGSGGGCMLATDHQRPARTQRAGGLENGGRKRQKTTETRVLAVNLYREFCTTTNLSSLTNARELTRD